MAATVKKHQAKIPDPDGDWTIVLPRRGKQSRRKFPKTEAAESQPWVPINVVESHSENGFKVMQNMEMCIRKLENSDFYRTFLEQMQTPQFSDSLSRVLISESKMQMVIYGIGSIESYQPSRLQLSLAILLQRRFDWIGDIEVFDPIISATESKVLEALGCSVLMVNELGRRQTLKPTLFFMPHCDAWLYDNLLQANWRAENLNQLVVLGNSFDRYEQFRSQFTTSTIYETAKHVFAVRKFSTEVRISTVSDDFFASFHESSWHFFYVNPEMDLELES